MSMRMSLLDMVQDILSDMDSDEVNSINDTVEALQVAQIVKSTYFLMCSNRNWGDEKALKTLDHIGQLERPNYLVIPSNMKELTLLSYNIMNSFDNKDNEYRELKYLFPDQFLRKVSNKPSTATNYIAVEDFGGSKFYVRNDAHPTYWTSFDDKHIITDSYNSNEDLTLVASRTRALVVMGPTWEMRDTFVPKLPIEGYAALLAEAKSTAFLVLKQMQNAKAEVASQKQQRWLARKNSTVNPGVRYQTYGRRRVK